MTQTCEQPPPNLRHVVAVDELMTGGALLPNLAHLAEGAGVQGGANSVQAGLSRQEVVDHPPQEGVHWSDSVSTTEQFKIMVGLRFE